MSKLDGVLAKAAKSFGVDIRSAREQCVEDRILLDSPGLNFILGGGLVPGRIYYLQGPESGGKSTLATYIASQVQKKYESHKAIVYLDFEYSLVPEHCMEMGLDVDNNFYLLRPKSGEEAFDMLQEIVDTNEVGLVIIDSITTISSKAQLEDAFSGFAGGKSANVLSIGLKKLMPYLYNNKCAMILISQERANLGVMYGPEWKGTGGYAPKFYSSWMARVTRTGDLVDKNKELCGIEMKVKNTKNKLGIPKRDATLKLYFHSGIDSEEEYMDYLVALGIVQKSGAMYEVENDAWGMGRVRGIEAVKTFLREHPDIYEQVKIDVNTVISGFTILDDATKNVNDAEDEAEEKAWAEYEKEDAVEE